MKKDKKTPKTNVNEYILSTDAEAILYGLILVLVSLIGFLNYGVVGEALTYVFAYIFGIFYILVYLFMIFFGLYLMIKKTVFKLHIDLKILGTILLLLGFCIAASMGNNLQINTFFSAYQNRIAEAQNHIFSMKSTEAIFSSVGGGFIGYLLTALLNSSISKTGTSIVVFAFVTIGLILLFKDLFIKFVKSIINFINKRKALHLNNQLNNENNVKEENINKKLDEDTKVDIPLDDYHVEEVIDNEPTIETKVDVDDYRQEEKPSTILNDIINDDVDKYTLDRNTAPEIEENDYFEEIKEEVKVEPEINNNDMKLNVDNISIQNSYIFPSIDLLKDTFNVEDSERKNRIARDRVEKINECFRDLKIGASVISYTIGPSVTRFDVKMNDDARTNSLCSIENDLAVRLGGNKTVRLETIVEGKDTSGIEVGNDVAETVSFKECMKVLKNNTRDKLLFPLGKNISGEIICQKLNEMPHMLICGTTGSGKSVFVHNIIMSLIMRNRPNELKLVLIDPKRVEFTKYQDIPHLLCPIVTSIDKGKVALSRLVEEMERRYDLFATRGQGASKLEEYYEVCDEFGYEKPPYIVMIIDEFADFMMSEGSKEVTKNVQRIAQMARGCGIHMVIATQRPSVKVITGDIKANIPTRIALSVPTQTDSRTIIDEGGAENLLGRGDLLAKLQTSKHLIRLQSAYVDGKDIYNVCNFIKSQCSTQYDPNFEDLTPRSFASISDDDNSFMKDYRQDEMYDTIKKYVLKTGNCSQSKLVATFSMGYAKAEGFLEALERDGIIRKVGNRRVLCDEYLSNLNEEGE